MEAVRGLIPSLAGAAETGCLPPHRAQKASMSRI